MIRDAIPPHQEARVLHPRLLKGGFAVTLTAVPPSGKRVDPRAALDEAVANFWRYAHDRTLQLVVPAGLEISSVGFKLGAEVAVELPPLAVALAAISALAKCGAFASRFYYSFSASLHLSAAKAALADASEEVLRSLGGAAEAAQSLAHAYREGPISYLAPFLRPSETEMDGSRSPFSGEQHGDYVSMLKLAVHFLQQR